MSAADAELRVTVNDIPNGGLFRSYSGDTWRRLRQDPEFSGAVQVVNFKTGKEDCFAKCAMAYPIAEEAT